MIKLTYKIICDLCKKECDEEIYECSNYINGVFPRPSGLFTYHINRCLEMCNDCAAPIAQAKKNVIDAALAKAEGKL